MNSQSICQWCKTTTAKIDSLEYENEILRSQNASMRERLLTAYMNESYSWGASNEDAKQYADSKIKEILGSIITKEE
jgi:hypothetical protein